MVSCWPWKVKGQSHVRESRNSRKCRNRFCHNGAAYGATDQTVNSTTVALLPLFRGRVILLFHALQIFLFYVFIRFTFLIYLRQRRRYMFSPARPRSSVCLSVCPCTRLLKNACMDLDKMLHVDRCRDMDEHELINFWARSGSWSGSRNRAGYLKKLWTDFDEI